MTTCFNQTWNVMVWTALLVGVTQGLSGQVAAGLPANSASDLEERKVQMKASVEMWESRVRKRLTLVEEITRTMDLRQIQTQRLAVDELREVLSDLDEEARAILEVYSGLGSDLKLYRAALEQAPSVFVRIAADLEKKALEKKTPELAGAYADFAAQARRLAAGYEGRAKSIDGLESDLARKMEFVRESREFVKDAGELLDAIPSSQGGLETEKLVQRVNAYVKAFEDTLRAIKGVSDKLGPSPAPNATQTPASGADSTGASANSKANGYRQRLSQLLR